MRRVIAGSIFVAAALLLMLWWRAGGTAGPLPVQEQRSVPLAVPSTESAREWDRSVSAEGKPVETPPLQEAATEADGAFEISVTRDGVPVPGAEVRLYLRGPTDPNTAQVLWRDAGSAHCDPDGRAVLFARAGAYLLSAREQGRVIARTEAFRAQGEDRTRVALIASAGYQVTGAALERGSREPVPLAEIVMTWLPSRDARGHAPEQERAYATADAYGRFAFSGVPAGTYLVEGASVGSGRGTRWGVEVPLSQPLQLLLGGAATLMGYVTHADGTPAADAEVMVLGSDAPPRTRTSATGAFSLEVEPGAVDVIARHAGESASVPAVIARSGQTHDLGVVRLGRGAAIEGVVRGALGPLADAAIALSPYNLNGDVARTFTGTDGRFSLQGLGPGSYDLVVNSAGRSEHVEKGLTLQAGDRFPLEIVLRGTGAITGTVKRHRGGPVAGIRVTGGRMSGGPFVGAVSAVTVSDAQGAFRLPGIEVGPAQVTALRADGSAATSAYLEIKEGETSSVELLLADEGELRGFVRRRDGTRVADARVLVLSTDEATRQYHPLNTNAAGEFRLMLPEGDYRVAALASGQLGVADEEIQRAKVKVGEVTEIELVVLDREPEKLLASGVVLEPWGEPARDCFVYATEAGQPSAFRYGVVTDAEGRFEVPREAGLNGLEVFDLQAEREGRSGAIAGVRAGASKLLLQLQASGRVEGRVLGSPLPSRYQVEVSYPELRFGKQVRSFVGSEFTLTGLRPGRARITVVAADGRGGQAPVEVRSDQVTRVDVTLVPPGNVRATLLDAITRAPLEAARVIGYSEAKRLPGGVVELRGLPEGTLELIFTAEGYVFQKRAVTVTRGTTVELGVIALSKAVLQARGGSGRGLP